MSKYLVAGTLLICTAAYANDVQYATPLLTNNKAVQWDIIGAYAADVRTGVKFIKPVKDCLSTSEILADDDYILQLRNCHQKRKGWLKI